MKKALSVIIVLLFSVPDLNAQIPELIRDEEFQQSARAGIDSLYNRNPQAAREQIRPWMESYPDHPVWLLWESMELWWIVLNDLHDDSYDDELFEKMEMADKAAVELLKRQPAHADAYVVRAVANGYIARQNANRQRWVRSIRSGRTAQQAHQRVSEVIPDLADNLLAEGLKKYYSAYLPETYRTVRMISWLLPDGDRQTGLQLLEESSRKAVFARPEASYFLGVIYLNYENELEMALANFRGLVDAYPDNGYYRRLLVRALYQQNRYRSALEEIEKAFDHWNRNNFEDTPVLKEELLYWKGRILKRNNRMDEAFALLRESHEIGKELPNQKGRSFHVLSGYYAGLIAERQGDILNARKYYHAVTQLESEPEVRERARDRMAEL